MQSIDTAPSRAGGAGTYLLLWLTGIALLLGLFAVAVHSLLPQIQTDLKQRSAAALDGTGISADNIQVDGLDITLNGTIDSAPLRDEAAAVVQGVSGVRKVINELRLGDKVDDASASEAIDTTDVAVAGPPASLQIIATSDSTVSVRGRVPDTQSAQRVYRALAGKFGAENVEHNISIDRDIAAPNWIGGAIELLDQFDNSERPSLIIANGRATLSGRTSSPSAARQKSAAARRLLGENLQVLTNLETIDNSQDVRTKSGELSLMQHEGQYTVSAVLATEAEAERVRTLAKKAYGSAATVDINLDSTRQPSPWVEEFFKAATELRDLEQLGLAAADGFVTLNGELNGDQARYAETITIEHLGERFEVVGSFVEVDDNAQINPVPLVAQQPVNKPDPVAAIDSFPTTTAKPTFATEQQAIDDLTRRLSAINVSSVQFKPSSAELTNESRAILGIAADVILTYDSVVVEIAGHTDAQGDALTNLELSKRRADTVRDFFITQNVPANRLRAIGYGETKPIGDNRTPEGRAKNRRIEFKL